jgi:signal transduction histidine kinase
MLASLRRRLTSLWPDPANTSLGWWMVAVHVVLVLLVGVGLSTTAISMLRVLTNEQGKARVLLAGATAREEVRRMTEDALTSARVLAQRPTLQRLLDQHQNDAITPFLRRFCDTSQLDACAVFSDTTLLAASGPALDWRGIRSESAEQGPTFLALPNNEQLAAFGAFVPVPGPGDVRIYVLRLLDRRLARELTQRVGTQVRFVNYREYSADPVSALTPLYSSALADGHSAVRRIDSIGLYEASVPLFASTGEAIGFIDTSVPISLVDSSTTRLIRELVLTTFILAVFAVLAGAILSRRVIRPVKALTDAAVRIGRGDFSVSIPPGGAAEVGALAQTMEEMRRNLLELIETLRRREAEAQAGRRARDSVLANISHEFRTPLAAQLASIELLLDNLETMSSDQRRELTESLQRGTLRLTRLIDNLLESVRIESGQLAIRHQRVDLGEVIEDARALIGSLLPLRRQQLEVSLPEDLPAIEGDKHRLTQVFVNLLANANKYAPEGSTVRIGAGLQNGSLDAWVEDEGPGPGSATADDIFAPFRRGAGEEPEAGGLGLGLWIVRSIVERHRGAVAVERTGNGRTRFTVSLPVEVTA